MRPRRRLTIYCADERRAASVGFMLANQAHITVTYCTAADQLTAAAGEAVLALTAPGCPLTAAVTDTGRPWLICGDSQLPDLPHIRSLAAASSPAEILSAVHSILLRKRGPKSTARSTEIVIPA